MKSEERRVENEECLPRILNSSFFVLHSSFLSRGSGFMTVNFNAGPAILPRPVLEQVQAELVDYQGRGVSIMEMSHRSPEFEAINAQAEALFKRLLGAGEGYRVVF